MHASTVAGSIAELLAFATWREPLPRPPATPSTTPPATRQALRRLHVYRHSDCENVRIAEPQAACLRHLPLTHMGLLGCGWDEEDLGPVLSELPDTVTSVCVSSPFKAALRMGHDDRGQVGRGQGRVTRAAGYNVHRLNYRERGEVSLWEGPWGE